MKQRSGVKMRWSAEAREAVSKVPFFVRKRVSKKVEEEAARAGAVEVRLEHVRACQQRYLNQMEEEVKGYQVESCFGASGCPNRAVAYDTLTGRIEELLARRDLKSFLKQRAGGSLKLHHEFRVSVSDCPNACSRPQIADIGLIGACKPGIGDLPCSQCEACAAACRENAISFQDQKPVLDTTQCVSCGRCVSVCPAGTLRETSRGYRVLAGGKLGWHPRLAFELPGIHIFDETVQIVGGGLDFYQAHCLRGERLGEILERVGTEEMMNSIIKKMVIS